MDGRGQKIIIDTEIYSPTALTIDYTNKRLYWADDNHILFANMDGTQRHKGEWLMCCLHSGVWRNQFTAGALGAFGCCCCSNRYSIAFKISIHASFLGKGFGWEFFIFFCYFQQWTFVFLQCPVITSKELWLWLCLKTLYIGQTVSPSRYDVLTRPWALKELSSSTLGKQSNPLRSTTHCASLKVCSPPGARVCVFSIPTSGLDLLFGSYKKKTVPLSLNWAVSICPSFQCPSTSARSQMAVVAIYVCCPLVGNTNVPVPQISTWLLTIKPVSPTAPPVRSVPFSLLWTRPLLLCSHKYFSSEGKWLCSHGFLGSDVHWRALKGNVLTDFTFKIKNAVMADFFLPFLWNFCLSCDYTRAVQNPLNWLVYKMYKTSHLPLPWFLFMLWRVSKSKETLLCLCWL